MNAVRTRKCRSSLRASWPSWRCPWHLRDPSSEGASSEAWSACLVFAHANIHYMFSLFFKNLVLCLSVQHMAVKRQLDHYIICEWGCGDWFRTGEFNDRNSISSIKHFFKFHFWVRSRASWPPGDIIELFFFAKLLLKWVNPNIHAPFCPDSAMHKANFAVHIGLFGEGDRTCPLMPVWNCAIIY